MNDKLVEYSILYEQKIITLSQFVEACGDSYFAHWYPDNHAYVVRKIQDCSLATWYLMHKHDVAKNFPGVQFL